MIQISTQKSTNNLLIKQYNFNIIITPKSNRFIGEESSAASDKRPVLTDEPTWIIDPIDGTSNFVRRIPITCISVGLVIDKVQILGIIYNPYMEEMFTAIRGQGAYLNGKRIRVSEETGTYIIV